MYFLYPLGLIGLVGIPILIIIHIIKSKYTEQTVASTYLWTLSEKFLRRRNPLSKLTGLISLILQILTIAVLAFVIAHPIFIVPGGAKEYCFILDGSGSMNMVREDGLTRFEYGKDAIEEMIAESTDGSTYTLITVGTETVAVYEQLSDKSQAITLLDSVTPDHSDIQYNDAIGIAQGYFNDNNTMLTYVVTDTTYETLTNVNVVNVGEAGENYSVYDIVATPMGSQTVVTGFVKSHLEDAIITLDVFVDKEQTAAITKAFRTTAGEPLAIELLVPTDEYYSLEVRIAEEDIYPLDNSYSVFNVRSENAYKVLVISDEPYFIDTLMYSTVGKTNYDVVSTEDYKNRTGYGLYIFDSYTPNAMPTDGAVWFINPNGSVENAGFSFQSEIVLEVGKKLEKTTSSKNIVAELTKGLSGKDIYVSAYSKLGVYGDFITLYDYMADPVIFVGTNDLGNREVIFAFDFNNSDFPMVSDCIPLWSNLIEYSFPAVLERTNYKSGETLEINIVANCESIQIDSPLGDVQFLEPAGTVAEYLLTETGVYTITLTVNGLPQIYYVFSESPESEREPLATAESLGLQGEAGYGGTDGTFDNIMIFFIILAVLFSADWVVYCYEKYQLR